jgi:hypothetical protein
MTELTNKIRSKSYWDTAILPEPYKRDRYLYETLEGVIGRASVSMRGWPLPFINDRESVEHGDDWIGQGWDNEEFGHIEAWRFFMSGQFNQLRAVGADWRTGDMATRVPVDFECASVIEVWEILFYVTEVFELAARFTMGGPPAERTTIALRLHGLEDRALVVGAPNRSPFAVPYKATIPEFSQERTLTSDELLGDASGIAVDVAREFFLRFGWQPASEQLVEIQRELTEGRW